MKIKRQPDGGISLKLGLEEALILRTLPERLRRLLRDPNFDRRVSERFFPSAYQDPAKDDEYRRLMGEDLRERKLAAIDGFEETLQRSRYDRRTVDVRISPEELEYWLGFLNDFRIMLGVELDISDDEWAFDMEHPHGEDYALLHFLTWLQEELLQNSGWDMPDVAPEDFRRDARPPEDRPPEEGA